MSESVSRLRWRYPHPSEDDARAEVINRIDGWWKAFTENAHRIADYFAGRDRWDLPAWMQKYLRSVVPGVGRHPSASPLTARDGTPIEAARV
jgi:hypothetical protein